MIRGPEIRRARCCFRLFAKLEVGALDAPGGERERSEDPEEDRRSQKKTGAGRSARETEKRKGCGAERGLSMDREERRRTNRIRGVDEDRRDEEPRRVSRWQQGRDCEDRDVEEHDGGEPHDQR